MADYKVGGYEFDVGKYLELINTKFNQDNGRNLYQHEQEEIVGALEKDIRNYAIIANNVGIDPKSLNRTETGERAVPYFVTLKERDATKEEKRILKENNPDYIKTNAFGQAVPMTEDEAKIKGFQRRNVIISTLASTANAAVGFTAMMGDALIPDWSKLSKNEFVEQAENMLFNTMPDELKQNMLALSRDDITVKDDGTLVMDNGKLYTPPQMTEKLNKKAFETIFHKKLDKKPDDIFQNAIDYYNYVYEKKSPTGKIDIMQSIENKNIGEMSEFVFSALTESLPVMVMAFLSKDPRMLFSMFGSMGAGSQYANIRDREDMKQFTKTINATGYGAVEGFFETFLGYGRIAKRMTANPVVKKAVATSVGRMIWNLGESAVEESTEELFTSIGQDAIKFITGEESFDGFDNVLKRAGVSAGIGAIGGGLFSGVAQTGMSIQRKMQTNIEAKTPQTAEQVVVHEELGAEPKPLETQPSPERVVSKAKKSAETTKVKYRGETTSTDGSKFHQFEIDSETDAYYTESEVASKDFDTKLEKVIDDTKARKTREYVEQDLSRKKSDMLKAYTEEMQKKINNDLSKVIDGKTTYDYIVDSMAIGESADTIVNDLKKQKRYNNGTQVFMSHLRMNLGIYGPQFMTPNEFGAFAENIDNGKASTEQTNKYITRINKLKQDIKTIKKEFNNEIKELKKKFRDSKKFRVEAQKTARKYLQGIPANFTKTDAMGIAKKIALIQDSESANKYMNEILDIADKAINRAKKYKNTKSVKKYLRADSKYIGGINESVDIIKKSVKAKAQLNVIPLIESINELQGSAEGTLSEALSLNGKTLSELNANEIKTMNDLLAMARALSDRINGKYWEGKKLPDVATDGANRVLKQAEIIKDKKFRKIVSMMESIRAETWQLMPRNMIYNLFGMKINGDMIARDALMNIFHNNLVYGEFDSQGLELTWAKTIEAELNKKLGTEGGKQAIRKVFGQIQKFSNYKNAVTIKFEQGNVKMTHDTMLYLYLLSQRGKARKSFINKNCGFYDETAIQAGKKRELISVTEADLDMIDSIVEGNAELKSIADAVSNLLNTDVYEKTNQTHENIKGTPLEQEENYIKMIREVRSREIAGSRSTEAIIMNLENAGFTKPATVSSKPLRLYNLSYILSRTLSESARYATMAEPIVDLKLALNTKIEVAGSQDTTLADVIKTERPRMYKFFAQYVGDLTSLNIPEEGLLRKAAKLKRVATKMILAFKQIVLLKQLPSFGFAVSGANRTLGVNGYKTILPELFKKSSLSTKELYKLCPWIEARRITMPSATSGSPEIDIAHNNKHMLISDFDFAVLKKVAGGIYRNMIETNTFDADKFNKDIQLLTNRTQPDFLWSSRSKIRMNPATRLMVNFYSGVGTTAGLAVENMQYLASGGKKREFLQMGLMIFAVANLLYTGFDKLYRIIRGKKEDLSLKSFATGVASQAMRYDLLLYSVRGLLGIDKNYGQKAFEAPDPDMVIYAPKEITNTVNDFAKYLRTHDKESMIKSAEHLANSLAFLGSYYTGYTVPVPGILALKEQLKYMIDVANDKQTFPAGKEPEKKAREKITEINKRLWSDIDRRLNDREGWGEALERQQYGD